MAEGIKAAQKCLQEFRTILKPSFGPWGKDVLLKSDTGTLYVTKNGSSIIDLLEIKHPVGALIKKSVQNYVASCGDFSKTYILIMSSLMDSFYKTHEDSYQRSEYKLITLSNALLHLNDMLRSPPVLTKIKTRLHCIACSSEELFEKYFDGLYETFLANKFDRSTLKILKKIIVDVLGLIQTSCENIKSIIENFDSICINVDGVSLSSSKIISGTIIDRKPIPQKLELKNCRFLLLSGQLSRSTDTITFGVDKKFFEEQEQASQKFYKNIITILLFKNINLLITEEPLPKQLQMLLTTKRIAYVSHVLEEELHRLSHLYGISILSGLHDIPSIQYVKKLVGQAKFFRSCSLGTKLCCHIGETVDNLNNSYNLQILLCAMSKGIGMQYREGLKAFFKVLLQCFSKEICLITPSCSAFEIVLSKVCHELQEFPTGRNEIMNTVVTSLSNSMLEVPYTLFNNSNQTRTKRLLINLNNFDNVNHSLFDIKTDLAIGIDGISGDVIDAQTKDMYDPFHSKLNLIASILEVSAQIVRIDLIVPVRKRLLLTVSNNLNRDEE